MDQDIRNAPDMNDMNGDAAPPLRHEDVRTIGEIIRDTRDLSADQVAAILEHQRAHGVRFGEAAIALGYASTEDVLRALAQQFNYAYGNEDQERVSPELVALNQPFGQQAEAFRAIRAQILLRTTPGDTEGAPRTKRALAVVSANPGDGKTYFCANLGIALAQLGGRTLIVDADLRGPRLHELFDISAPGTGLAGLLTGRRGDGVVLAAKGVSNLYVLPVGISPPNPVELLQGPAFGVLLRELLNRFDHVIVDTPAIEHGTDAVVAAARCGVALVIARKDESRVEALQGLVQDLSAVNVALAGVVMNEY